MVTGGVEVAEALLQEKFDYIFYTGSSNIGKIVMGRAAEHLTPVTLELGGKKYNSVLTSEVHVAEIQMYIHGNTYITNTLHTNHTHPPTHTHTHTLSHTHTHVCSSVIVADDANLEVAGRRIVWGKCLNAGQSCIAPDYVLCTAAKKDRLLDACRTAIMDFFGMVCIPMVMSGSLMC